MTGCGSVRSETRQELVIVVFAGLCFALAVILTAIWNPVPQDSRPRVPIMVNTTVMPDGMMVEWSTQPNVQ